MKGDVLCNQSTSIFASLCADIGNDPCSGGSRKMCLPLIPREGLKACQHISCRYLLRKMIS